MKNTRVKFERTPAETARMVGYIAVCVLSAAVSVAATVGVISQDGAESITEAVKELSAAGVSLAAAIATAVAASKTNRSIEVPDLDEPGLTGPSMRYDAAETTPAPVPVDAVEDAPVDPVTGEPVAPEHLRPAE